MMLVILMGMFFVSGMQAMFMISMMIMIVLMYSSFIYIFMGGYWFGYVLMMVMLSGVLVVFTYMASLSPNESFENYNMLYMVGVLLLLVSSYFYWMMDVKWGYISLSLWSTYVSMFNLFMVIFLLMIMLMVVWFSYMYCGAIRVN